MSGKLPQTGRVMVKDEDLCVHCSLCAERCPTAAWDMQKFTLEIPYVEDEADDEAAGERSRLDEGTQASLTADLCS